jgi:hypothetical protein
MSLLETIGTSLSPEVIDQIGKQLGVDGPTAEKGVEMGVPMLLAALSRNAQSPEGAAKLTNALEKDHDGSVLSDILGLIGNYQQGEGDGILKHVLGDKREKVEGTIGENAGLDAGALLQILAPIVLGALGSQQRSEGLNPQGVAATLEESTEELKRKDENQVMSIVTTLLDSNKDGSIVDEVLGMIGRFFSRGK